MMSVFERLSAELAGTLTINEGELVDITDPCYDKDVWCRINGVKLSSGEYNCYAYIDHEDIYEWGERPWACEIRKQGTDGKMPMWEYVGRIGVDAGLAGFFVNKPDFKDGAWGKFCAWVFDGDKNYANGLRETFLITDGYKGFFTESGSGDGYYSVYALKIGEEIIGLVIDFCGEDDE